MLTRLLLLVMLGGCTPGQLAGNESAGGKAAGTEENSVDSSDPAAAATGEPVSGLPFSHGKSFRTLDEYLEHLERYAAPIDQPWWREIRPGVYEQVKRMPGAPRETATREELIKRFGFTR